MNDEIFETPSSTPNFQTELAAQLAELVPEAMADGKIDVIKLQELLAKDAAETSERFGLFWPGKQRALRVAQMPTAATLRPEPEKSKDWDKTKNVFIEGDNLEVLKILQKHYHGKIKMIYIDPPYNTGKDFVYPDNFKEGLENYLEWTRQVSEEGKRTSTNSETEGRYHSNWLNMMYPRLKLARNLLTDDGCLFASIGEDEVTHFRKLLDEIFGESNFVSQITLITGANQSGEGVLIQKNLEYVLVYARNVNHAVINRVDEVQETLRSIADAPTPLVTRPEMGYTVYWKEGTGELLPVFDYDKSKLGNNEESEVYEDRVDLIEQGYLPIRPGKRNNQLHRWRWGVETFIERKDEVVVQKSGGKLGLYFRQSGNLAPKNFVNFSGGTQELKELFGGKALFDYPKSTKLIKYLVSIGAHDDSIVLDFFAGSSTTADAIMSLNSEDGGTRSFIQVQLPEPTPEGSEAALEGYQTIAEVSRKRIELAGLKIETQLAGRLGQESTKVDHGFRSYRLVDSNFAKWRVSSDLPLNEFEQHLFDLRGSAVDEANQDDLLAEVLIKQGFSLSEVIKSVSFSDIEFRSIGDGLILAYLDEHEKPSLEVLREAVASNPAKLLIVEDAFQGDDELKTNLAQLCRSKNIELWTA
jgi:adenine-specific DNA-methyltransferase